MIKTKSIVWLLSIFLMTLYSCSNDNDDSVKLLKKIVETSEAGTSEITLFTYNGNQIVSIDGTLKRTDFTYTDGLIAKTVTLNKTTQLLVTIEYSYLNGKLDKVESLGYRIKYIKNSDKTISYERFMISGNQQVKEFHGKLYFENANLIEDDRTVDNTNAGVISNYTVSYDYDLKKNPLFHVTGFRELLNQNEKISLNNSLISTVITSVSKDDQITSSANFYKSSFKYDLDNYPIERVSENEKTGYLKTEYFY